MITAPFLPTQESSSTAAITMPPLEIHRRELPNGLQILVQPDFTAPVATVQYWCGTGSIHEGRWLGGGLSHLLEHLMFKGTPELGNSQMAQRIQDLGGHMNAYTSFDRTVYYVDLPAENWAGAFDLWTDAMQHAAIPEAEFEPEKEVIRREFAMGEDSPDSVLSKLIFSTAFTSHPCRFPVIGHLDLFNRLTRDDVVSYYRERYAPQNLTLIVVGAVDPGEVFARAEKAWATEPRRWLPDPLLPMEPAQPSARFVSQPFPTEVVRLASLYHIPGLGHADIPALQILSMILGAGRSSILYRKLVEEEGLAEEIDAFAYTPAQVGLFGVDARCAPANQAALTVRLREELALIRRTVPSVEDVDRAKRLALTQQLHQLKTMSGKAAAIGSGWMMARDPHFNQAMLARLQLVTREEIAAVAARYLVPEGESWVELVPAEMAKTKEAVTRSHEAEPQPELLVTPPSSPRLLYLASKKIPLVAFRATMPGGLLAATAAQAGLSRLTAQMLLKGTRRRSAEELARAVENLGGHLHADSGNNSAMLSLELLAQDWEKGLDIFCEILLEPQFDEREFVTEKRKQLAAIQVEQDQPMAVCRDLLKATLFGYHPYATSILGTAASVQALQREDVVRFAREIFQTQETILSVTGPQSAEVWPSAWANRLGSFANAAPIYPVLTPFESQIHSPRRVEKTIPKEQAVLQIAFPIPSVTHPDQIPLSLVHEALADLGTRLFVRIREELGLAYFVSASRFLGSTTGYFVFYAGTDPKKRLLVEKAMLEEIAKLAQHGLTSAELERARAKLLSEEKINAQNPSSVVAGAALDELLGLGYAHSVQRHFRLAHLTLEEINLVLQRYFEKENYVIATVSPE